MALEKLGCFLEHAFRLRTCAAEPRIPAQPDERFAGPQLVPVAEEELVRLLAGVAHSPHVSHTHVGELQQGASPLEVVRSEIESAGVIAGGLLEVQRSGAIAGQPEEPKGRLFQALRLTHIACGLRELECLLVVVGQQLGVVGHAFAGHALDPFGSRNVFAGALRTRNLRVRDITNQEMPERILRLLRDR